MMYRSQTGRGTVKSVVRLLVVASLVITACGSSGGGDGGTASDTMTSSTTTPVTTAPTATAPAAVTPTTDAATMSQPPEAIDVTFDGKECTVAGPTSVPTGEHYFVVSSPSYFGMDLYVSMMVDDHRYQDLLDPQTRPGEYYPKPSWVVYATQTDGPPSGRILAEDEREYQYTLDQPEHPHVIYLGTARSLWFCSPLEVVDTSG